MVETSSPIAHTENRTAPETSFSYRPLLGLQGRLAIGGPALFPSTTVELTQGINPDNEVGTMALLHNASIRERKQHWATQPEQSKDAQLSQWKKSVVAKINLIPASTIGQDHAEFFERLGIDVVHFNEEDAQRLYDTYFSKNLSGVGIGLFAADVVEAFATSGDNWATHIKSHLAAAKWMAGMFGGNSAEIITQLIDAKIDNLNTSAFVATRKDKVNNLSDHETDLLNFLTEGQTAPVEPPRTQTNLHENEHPTPPTLPPPHIPEEPDSIPTGGGQPLTNPESPLASNPSEIVLDQEIESKRVTQAYGEKVQGASHIQKDVPCQDAIRIESDPEHDILSVAVADGHGSEKFVRSEKGAQIAVEVLNDQFFEIRRLLREKGREKAEEYVRGQLAKKISENWNTRVYKDISSNPFSPEEQRVAKLTSSSQKELFPYGSTLLGAMMMGDELLLVQIGDGNILITDDQGVISPIPHDPALLGNETFSLCQKDAIDNINVMTISTSSFKNPMISVTTDGLSNSYEDDDAFHQLMTDLYTRSDDSIKSELHNWLNEFSTRGSGDDIALGILRIKNAEPASSSH